MKDHQAICRIALWISLIAIIIWGCAGKPFDAPQSGEIPKGPGIFTKGDDGAVLYDSDEEKQQTAPSKPMPPAASDYEEFQAYRQWLQWKQVAAGTPEYEEFQQWLKWRQYKQWKESQ